MENGKRGIFTHILNIANLYVAIIGILAILAAVGVFSIRAKPEVEVLKPIYSFDMKRITEALKEYKAEGFIKIPSNSDTILATYGEPSIAKESAVYLLPYEAVGAWKWGRSSSLSPRTIWYQFGITDTNLALPLGMNYSAKRTDEQKRLGLFMLYTLDLGNQAFKDSLTLGNLSGPNLLDTCYQIFKSGKGGENYEEFIVQLGFATKVYSLISISNKSSVPMDQIRLFVNDVWETGMLEVVGWTAVSQIVDLTSNGPNLRITIERLEPGQSIEILLRGSKYVRGKDILVSMPPLSGIRKELIVKWMVIALIGVVALFCADCIMRRKVKRESSNSS